MARRPPEQTANPARGAVLVVVAVLIGLVLLRHGLDTDTSGSDRSQEQTDGQTRDSSTTSTTAGGAARDPGDVSLIVANGTTTPGLAEAWTGELSRQGYDNLVNAKGVNYGSSGTPRPPSTTVYFASGYEADAEAVALLLGASVGTAALPTDLPVEHGSASIVVVLGTDFQGKLPSGA